MSELVKRARRAVDETPVGDSFLLIQMLHVLETMQRSAAMLEYREK